MPLHETMFANLAARGTPEHRALGLGPALAGWLDWSGGHACPTAASAGSYFDSMIGTHGAAGAQSRFALFQIAAAYAWGAAETAHLASVLRSRLVTNDPGRIVGKGKYAAGLARLPLEWRQPFEQVIATNEAGGSCPGQVHWSSARIRSVISTLAMWHEHCMCCGQDSTPSGVGFEAWANALTSTNREREPVSATTVASYLERVLSGYGRVIAPGFASIACALVIDDWKAREQKEPPRRSKSVRVVGATTLYNLGLAMVEEALAAPVRNLTAAETCRNGILLSMGTSLPQRARALSWLAFGKTLFLEPDYTIRVCLPAHALKLRETRKGKQPPFERTFRNPRLWQALHTWRAVFRPLYDEGDWLFPSKLSRTNGISEDRLGGISRKVTEARLGIAVSIHDLRDNVATEVSETMENGAVRSASLLGHRDARTTLDHYDHAEDRRALRAFETFIESRLVSEPDLIIGCDQSVEADCVSDAAAQKSSRKQSVTIFRTPPFRGRSAVNAEGD